MCSSYSLSSIGDPLAVVGASALDGAREILLGDFLVARQRDGGRRAVGWWSSQVIAMGFSPTWPR